MEVAAHGVADAEHLVGKELERVWTSAGWPPPEVDVAGIERVGPGGARRRIAESFAIDFEVRASVPAAAPSADEARRTVLRRSRELLSGTRYARLEWTWVEVR